MPLLTERYAAQDSQFRDVEGVSLHYRDSGQGQVVLLLPGHLGNVFMYSRWTAILAPHFRVVSVDWPPYGLSGLDPTTIYSTDRAADLVLGLMDTLDIREAMLVGTSNGATVASHLAARHPNRVSRLAVSTLPLGAPPKRVVSPALLEQFELYGSNESYRPASFYRAVLEDIFADPANVSDDLVTLYTDVNNRPGGYSAVNSYIRANRKMYDEGRLPDLYFGIEIPVFIQWGDGGKVLPPELAMESVNAYPAAPVVLRRYPASGHMPMLEEPELTGNDLLRFLQGKLDREARPPTR